MQVVVTERGIKQHDSVRRGEMLTHGVQGPLGAAIVQPHPSHDAHALRLDEDFPVVVLPRSDLAPVMIVGAQEPVAIPPVFARDYLHLGGVVEILPAFLIQPALLRDLGHLFGR